MTTSLNKRQSKSMFAMYVDMWKSIWNFKIRKILILGILASLYSGAILADIIQTSTLFPIKAAIEEADKETIIIFDIDDVLLTAKDQILQPAHKDYNNRLTQKIQKRIPRNEAENLWSVIMLTSHSEMVDPTIILLIKDIQSKGVKILGLTNLITGSLGKISSIEDWSIKRLRKHNINFKNSWKTVPQKKFTNLKPREQNRFATFQDGVIFTSRLPKGEVLKAFLQYVKIKPKKIIFTDDKLVNLESVQSFCLQEQIEFIGFQYTAVRERSKEPLNKIRAKRQFEILEKKHKWLSDEEADNHFE